MAMTGVIFYDSDDSDVTNPFVPEPWTEEEMQKKREDIRLGRLPSPFVTINPGQTPDPSWGPLSGEPWASIPHEVHSMRHWWPDEFIYTKRPYQESSRDKKDTRCQGDTTAPTCPKPNNRKPPRWLRDLGPIMDDLGLSRQNGLITSHRLRSSGSTSKITKRARLAPARPKSSRLKSRNSKRH